MKTLLALVLALALAACSPAVVLPDGVTCGDESLSKMTNVPEEANPQSAEYNEDYARGYYLGMRCDVDF